MDGRRIAQIDPLNDQRWDQYVQGHTDSIAYHLGAWAEILERSYRYKPEYLALIERDGRLCGILPVATRWGRFRVAA